MLTRGGSKIPVRCSDASRTRESVLNKYLTRKNSSSPSKIPVIKSLTNNSSKVVSRPIPKGRQTATDVIAATNEETLDVKVKSQKNDVCGKSADKSHKNDLCGKSAGHETENDSHIPSPLSQYLSDAKATEQDTSRDEGVTRASSHGCSFLWKLLR